MQTDTKKLSNELMRLSHSIADKMQELEDLRDDVPEEWQGKFDDAIGSLSNAQYDIDIIFEHL